MEGSPPPRARLFPFSVGSKRWTESGRRFARLVMGMSDRPGWRWAPAAALALALAAPAAARPLRHAELTVESDLQAGFRCRWRARGGGLDLLLLAAGPAQPGGPPRLAVGLDCPLGLAGPVQPQGLLRQAFRPLGYAPGSGVFREETGFRLDGSLSGPCRRALLLSPLPGPTGLFVWEGKGAAPRVGALLAIGRPPGEPAGLRLEGLALTSGPPADPEAEDWYPPRPGFPGGALVHAGGRLLAAGGGLDLCAALLLSGGEQVPPGLLTQADLRTTAAGRALRVELELLGGACSASYRTPDGDPPGAALQGGGRLALGLERTGRAGGPRIEEAGLELGLCRALGHPPLRLFPGSAGGARLPAEALEWELRGVLRLRPAGRLELGLEGEAGQGLSLAVELGSPALRLRLEAGSRSAGDRLRLDGEAALGPARLRLGCGAEAGRLDVDLAVAAGGARQARGRLWAEAGVRGLDLSGGPPPAEQVRRGLRGRLGWQLSR